MSIPMLDNPVWYALNSHHRHLAIMGKLAARYQPDVGVFTAMLESTTAGFEDLRNLLAPDEVTGLVGALPKELPGWEVLQSVQAPQMVCNELQPASHVDALLLTAADVPAMLELIALAQPGPFLPRTIEMGQYFGVRQEGQLVAMAGERIHPSGFCEVSAVCTHPDYRGRGYAGALTTLVAEQIIARGEIPFLHVVSTNDAAIRLYKKLGFRLRTEVQLNILKRLA